MKWLLVVFFVVATAHAAENVANGVFAIHGGFAPEKDKLTPKMRVSFCDDMRKALAAGYAAIQSGKPGVDAVQGAIRILEDSPWFNAGKGAVFTHEGTIELDAALMEGKNRAAGAVANVTKVKNPILLARAVMDKTPHVLLAGEGADKFAKDVGLETVDPSYFRTDRQWKRHLEDLEKEKSDEHGTVGAVALDAAGNLAAGTSTGGLSNKKHGRIGDTPIVGAGTYADNEGAAVSCTGHGEWFIRYHVGSEISALMKYKHMLLRKATHHVLFSELSKKNGNGGLVAIDRKGNISMEANDEGLLRGYATKAGVFHAYVYDDECAF